MSLINPDDPVERQNEKLMKITEALMRRVEYGTAQSGAAYAQFERAALLEKRVRERTTDLEKTLDLLHESNAQLARATRDAEAAQRNLADAIETISEGFALFDGDDNLVMCNTRFCRDFRDIAGDLQPGLGFDGYVARISRSRYLALPDGMTAEGWARQRVQRHQDQRVLFNVQLIHDRWLQVSEHRTKTGGTVVLQTDVTDIIRMERQERARLADKQARMIRATLDHLNQGVAIFDENARLVGWNAKIGTLLAIPARKLHIGASFQSLLEHLGDEFDFTRGIDRVGFSRWALHRGARDPINFEVRHKTSQTLQIFGRGMPDRGVVISCTDVTAERAAEQKLSALNELLEQRVMERTLELEDALSAAERANASKSRFVAAASHDLLQPLSAAKLFISSLGEAQLTARESSVLAKAESALSSAEQLIDALLDISKLDSDALHFDIRPVALREVLAPLHDEMEVLAAAKGLKLRIVPSSVTVATDPAYLRRIVQNLMANAIRYTDTGRVVLGVRRKRDAVRVEVWDTGPGIAEEDQGTVFEEFKRLDTKASSNDGLGLGLAIVERACARLGHPLGLWSEPGRGSCFMVNVPLARPESVQPRDSTRAMRPQSFGQLGLIVLLVENDPQMLRAITILLESWGVSVIEATDGESALELMADLEIVPDALIFDQHLGDGMTGVDLLKAMQTLLGPLPAAIITAERAASLQSICATLGAELMAKPVDRSALIAFLTDATVRDKQV